MASRLRKRDCSLNPLKKLVYLISPNKINKSFYSELNNVLSFKNVKFFQLRLKGIKRNKLLKIATKIKKITKKHKVNFIINDSYNLACRARADGCHMGQLDAGGQSEIEASKNLNEINKINDSNFLITFSYGRGLQASALKAFGKDQNNIENIQKAFNHRAKMNSLSSKGEWLEELEKETAA